MEMTRPPQAARNKEPRRVMSVTIANEHDGYSGTKACSMVSKSRLVKLIGRIYSLSWLLISNLSS